MFCANRFGGVARVMLNAQAHDLVRGTRLKKASGERFFFYKNDLTFSNELAKFTFSSLLDKISMTYLIHTTQ